MISLTSILDSLFCVWFHNHNCCSFFSNFGFIYLYSHYTLIYSITTFQFYLWTIIDLKTIHASFVILLVWPFWSNVCCVITCLHMISSVNLCLMLDLFYTIFCELFATSFWSDSDKTLPWFGYLVRKFVLLVLLVSFLINWCRSPVIIQALGWFVE